MPSPRTDLLPTHFDTRRFFLHESAPCMSAAQRRKFARDLERFAWRTEAAGRHDADAMIFETLVIFGKAGRDIDAARWTALALDVTAQVRRGDVAGAAARLMPQGADITHESTDDGHRIAHLTIRDDEITLEAEAAAWSPAAAMVAVLFRALACHFSETPDNPADAAGHGDAGAGPCRLDAVIGEIACAAGGSGGV